MINWRLMTGLLWNFKLMKRGVFHVLLNRSFYMVLRRWIIAYVIVDVNICSTCQIYVYFPIVFFHSAIVEEIRFLSSRELNSCYSVITCVLLFFTSDDLLIGILFFVFFLFLVKLYKRSRSANISSCPTLTKQHRK